MSDNDLVKRGEVADAAFEILKMLTEAEHHGKIDRTLFSLLYHDIGAIAFLPAVPQEMSAREYEEAFQRITYEDVETYRVWWEAIHDEDWGRAVAIVEKWAREHPERSKR